MGHRRPRMKDAIGCTSVSICAPSVAEILSLLPALEQLVRLLELLVGLLLQVFQLRVLAGGAGRGDADKSAPAGRASRSGAAGGLGTGQLVQLALHLLEEHLLLLDELLFFHSRELLC